jgi:hypothetical protein
MTFIAASPIAGRNQLAGPRVIILRRSVNWDLNNPTDRSNNSSPSGTLQAHFAAHYRFTKNIYVYFSFDAPYKRFILSHTEGRIAIVMKRGMRCGGRGSVRRAVGRRAGGA